jgi:hypothetical protein
LIASIAVRICESVMAAGSRVKSGSTKNGLSARTTKWTWSPGMSTRGTRSTTSFTWATTMPSLNADASTTVGVSSVFGPV